MQTVLSRTGIEVCYPCTVHLLSNGENFECEYKSDHTGRDLLEYICRIQNIRDSRFWGLKFMNTASMDEERFWLDLDKLIRPQVKNISPTRFYFRVKVYPPEPYKIVDHSVRQLIFQQLRLDLLGGRLFCNVTDASMLVALVLQYVHGNFLSNLTWMYLNYIKTKIIRKERCAVQFFEATQKRSLELYPNLLVNLERLEVEDMFLRLASKLDSYGVEPFLLRNIEKQDVLMWMNYCGIRTFNRKQPIWQLKWIDISKVTHEGRCLFIHLTNARVMVLECLNFSECNYVWSIAVDHFIYFTSIKCTNAIIEAKFLSEKDRLSELSSFFGSCMSSKFEAELLDEQLHESCSLFKLIEFNSWKSHLSILYAVLLLYIMGSQSTIFDELPMFYSLRTFIKGFLSKFLFNKMLM